VVSKLDFKQATLMKKITYLLTLICVFGLSSCESILDQKPLSQPSLETFYKNELEATLGVNATYQVLATTSMYNRGQIAFAMMEDHTFQAILSDMIQISELNFQTINPTIFNWYNSCYLGIARANFAIDRIPKIDAKRINATTQKRLVAEAKFLRGLYYYHLVRIFGEVPIITVPTESIDADNSTAKSPEADVWKQIEKDFSEAIPDLPLTYAAADRGRATQGAAKIFLAQAYQWQKKNQEALSLVNEVVNAKTPTMWTISGKPPKMALKVYLPYSSVILALPQAIKLPLG
jgi:hypothetical protein